MADNRHVAADVLQTAAKVVMTERGNQHGDAEDSFEMIANLWTQYIKGITVSRTDPAITAFDVAQMMVLLKVARSVFGNGTNMDHYTDAAGYTSLAAMIASRSIPMGELAQELEANLGE